MEVTKDVMCAVFTSRPTIGVGAPLRARNFGGRLSNRGSRARFREQGRKEGRLCRSTGIWRMIPTLRFRTEACEDLDALS
jgi:hypothetical protein